MLSESPLELLVTTVAAMVGLATRSMNSRRLGVNFISSGREDTTAETDRIPFLTGRADLVPFGGGSWVEGVAGTSKWVGLCFTGAGDRRGDEGGGTE